MREGGNKSRRREGGRKGKRKGGDENVLQVDSDDGCITI